MSITTLAADTDAVAIDHTQDGYTDWLQGIKERALVFLSPTARKAQPLFRVAVKTPLFDVYLNSIPEELRAHYTCRTCKAFFERYGNLAIIDQDGKVLPLLWNVLTPPPFFMQATRDLYEAVANGQVIDVYVPDVGTVGYPDDGKWHHVSFDVPMIHRYRKIVDDEYEVKVTSASQAEAMHRQHFEMLKLALSEYPLPLIEQAVTIVDQDTLKGGEKVIARLKWLRDLQATQINKDTRINDRQVWRAIASASVGFCHPRSGMVGVLLNDLKAGKSFAAVKKSYEDKTKADVYLRPTAPASTGNIERGEKIIEMLGLAPSLPRRAAKLSEMKLDWQPTPEVEPEKPAGVFGALKEQAAKRESRAWSPTPLNIPAINIRWTKFVETVLPKVEAMRLYIQPSRSAYVVMTTAVNADAPPLMQWDTLAARNPIGYYMFVDAMRNAGSYPHEFGLQSHTWVDVTGVSKLPHMWNPDVTGPMAHMGTGVFLHLKGARFQEPSALGLFPGALRTDLHEIRATIEAYSNANTLEGTEEGDASAVAFSEGHPALTLQVIINDQPFKYIIDSYDK